MRRRELMRTLAGIGSLAVCGSRGRADERVRRVGVLNGVVRHSEGEVLVALFRDTLANLGWSEEANLRIEVHWSGDPESTLRAARKVLDWKPDVVLARNTISVEKL